MQTTSRCAYRYFAFPYEFHRMIRVSKSEIRKKRCRPLLPPAEIAWWRLERWSRDFPFTAHSLPNLLSYSERSFNKNYFAKFVQVFFCRFCSSLNVRSIIARQILHLVSITLWSQLQVCGILHPSGVSMIYSHFQMVVNGDVPGPTRIFYAFSSG